MQKILKTGFVASTIMLAANPALLLAQTSSGDITAEGQRTTAAKKPSGSLRFSTGLTYSKGKYGEIDDTEVFSVPVSLTYKEGPLKIRVSAPWVKINGPGSLISTPEGRDGGSGSNSGPGSSNSGSGNSNSGSGSSGSGGSDIEVEDDIDDDLIDDDGAVPTPLNNKRSGIGDTSVALTYSFELGGDFYIEPTAKVKLPTASRAKRLGTGEIDFTLSSDLVKDIGNASFYIHGRRKFAGKPTGSTIRSTWGAGGGASVRAGKGLTIGADYDWQQSAFAGRKASSEITGWLNTRLADGLGLTLFAATGLNRNSADLSAGATVSVRF